MSTDFVGQGILTDHQMIIVDSPGNMFVDACPGSGKTRSASARIANHLEEGRRVAACSYSNVSAAEMRESLEGLHMVPGPESFIGTLHAFLLRYVLYPYGHLVMQNQGPIRVLLGDQDGPTLAIGRARIRIPLKDLTFAVDGSMLVRRLPRGSNMTADEIARLVGADASRMKLSLARTGTVTADDAMYFCYRVLMLYPRVAACLGARFDELIVDEAQDTSELQLACLRLIKGSGRLTSLVLIGDLDQSIYSFNGASPAGCAALAAEFGLTTVPLTENHRSSQKICSVVNRFTRRPVPDSAVGPNAGCSFDPRLMLYDPADIPSLLTRFNSLLLAAGIAPEVAAVLGRSNAVIDAVNGVRSGSQMVSRVRHVGGALAGYAVNNWISKRDLEALEDCIAHCAWGRRLERHDTDESWAMRQACMGVLARVPSAATSALAWWVQVRELIRASVADLASTPANSPGLSLKASGLSDEVSAEEAFCGRRGPAGLLARTVHDVKGQSKDAVLVVADPKPTHGRRLAQSEVWCEPLRGANAHEGDNAEELRILFVALSRARRVCVLALPNHTSHDTISLFEASGFMLA